MRDPVVGSIGLNKSDLVTAVTQVLELCAKAQRRERGVARPMSLQLKGARTASRLVQRSRMTSSLSAAPPRQGYDKGDL